ncbi:MAG: hypothetical protein JXL82_05330 [Candidatus Omnitrophica bacterium]|nr:hypothetical protein [Candidatus Omnitrophota bacterium]
MVTNLKNKKVIITAGPTWVKLDSVRIISNTASGLTGILLAEKFCRLGAKVTLLLGHVCNFSLNSRIRLIRFKFFDEFNSVIKKELSLKKYDWAIHSAAVSDYKPAVLYKRKLGSGLKNLRISFKPTPKIINTFKRMQPGISLVAFKFEPDASEKILVSEARKLIWSSRASFVIANTLKKDKYSAYLVSADKSCGPVFTRNCLADSLIDAIKKYDA